MIKQALRGQHAPKINQCGVDIKPSGEVTDARIPDLVTRQAASINTVQKLKNRLCLNNKTRRAGFHSDENLLQMGQSHVCFQEIAEVKRTSGTDVVATETETVRLVAIVGNSRQYPAIVDTR